jgi:hypothetical protein
MIGSPGADTLLLMMIVIVIMIMTTAMIGARGMSGGAGDS